MRPKFGIACAILMIFGVHAAENPKQTASLHGKVIKVADGDMITVLLDGDDHRSLKVRLEGIDAPEKTQAFGARSTDAIKELIAGKAVDLQKTGEDKYGRSLAFVRIDSVDVNSKLIEDGWAWHYKKYNSDQRLAALEDSAKEARRGLWSEANPLPPWEFRHRQRPSPAASTANETKAGNPDPEHSHWLNMSSGVRHNNECENFANTKRGRYCKADEGKPCGKCCG